MKLIRNGLLASLAIAAMCILSPAISAVSAMAQETMSFVNSPHDVVASVVAGDLTTVDLVGVFASLFIVPVVVYTTAVATGREHKRQSDNSFTHRVRAILFPPDARPRPG